MSECQPNEFAVNSPASFIRDLLLAKDVVQMLKGEESVISELYFAGIFTSLPSHMGSWELETCEKQQKKPPEASIQTNAINSEEKISNNSRIAFKASGNQRITRSKMSPGTYLRSKFGEHIIHSIPTSKKQKGGDKSEVNLKHSLFTMPNAGSQSTRITKKARRSMMR